MGLLIRQPTSKEAPWCHPSTAAARATGLVGCLSQALLNGSARDRLVVVRELNIETLAEGLQTSSKQAALAIGMGVLQ